MPRKPLGMVVPEHSRASILKLIQHLSRLWSSVLIVRDVSCPNPSRFIKKPALQQNRPNRLAQASLNFLSPTDLFLVLSPGPCMEKQVEKPPLPLRLCRPPPKSKPKLKSTQKPEWTGAGGPPFEEMEGNQLPIVRHKPSAQEWCLQAETNFSSRRDTNPRLHKNSQPGSRNSFQNRHGIIGSASESVEAGGNNATLVSTFGEKWRTHSREIPNLSLPMPRTHPNRKSSSTAVRSEWFVPAEASSAPANPARQIKSSSTNAFRSNSQMPSRGSRQPSVNALRSSHVERALGFVSLAKTSPVSKQRASAGGTLLQGATRDDLKRHQRRSSGFY